MHKSAAIFGLSMGVSVLIALACLNLLFMYTRPESQISFDILSRAASGAATFSVIGFLSGAKWARKSNSDVPGK